MKNINKLLLFLIFGFSLLQSQAQIIMFPPFSDIDSAFRVARDFAYNNSTDTARAISFQILDQSPDYDDVKLLIGRTYAWEKKYAQAEHYIAQVLGKNPMNADAMSAFIDLKYWTANYDTSLGMARFAWKIYPDNSNFPFMAYKNLRALQKDDQAFRLIRKLFKQYPDEPRFRNELKQLIDQNPEMLKLWFQEAKTLAFNKDYKGAQKVCREILRFNSEYQFIRTFMARSYAWEGVYDTARIEYLKVFKADSSYYACIDGLTDVEQWTMNYDTALGYTGWGIRLYPSDTNFYIKRARILFLSGECKKAIRNCNIVLRKDKHNAQAQELLELASQDCRKESFEFEYLWQYWEVPTVRPFHFFSVRYAHQFPKLKLIPKINFGDNVNKYQNESLLMDSVDFQFGFDMYPELWDKAYGYFSYAFSPRHFLFPLHRIDAEIYQAIGEKAEVSLGERYMQFIGETRAGGDSIINVFIVTGQVSGYLSSKWWAGMRPYISPQFSLGTQSLQFEGRRLFNDMYNYASLMVIFGQSPDDKFTQIGDYNNLKSRRIRFGYKDRIDNRVSIEARLGFGWDEYRNNQKRNVADFNLIVIYPF